MLEVDEALGTGDGATTAFQLVKRYASGSQTWVRTITKPVAGTVRVNAWGRIQQVRVKGGAGTVVVKVPAKATGKATLTVRWLGSASVTSSSVKQVVQVKRR